MRPGHNLRTEVKGTPRYYSCTVDQQKHLREAKCSMAVGTTDNETKWQLGKQLATSEYLMCRGTMDSLDYNC